MTQISLEDLKRHLPVSFQVRTAHLLVSISSASVAFHAIEHDPVWGFRRHGSWTVEERWRGTLAEITASFSYPQVQELFLAGGVLVEGDRRAAWSDLAPALHTILAEVHFSAPIVSCLPVGRGVAPCWYSLLAGQLATTDVAITTLPHLDADWPPEDTLDALLAANAPVFPWEVSAVILETRESGLVSARLPVLRPGAHPGEDGRFCGRARLRFSREDDQRLILVRRRPDGGEEAVIAYRVEKPAKVETLEVEYATWQSTPSARLAHGALSPLSDPAWPASGVEVHRVLYKTDQSCIAFLLDGSMTEAEFGLAREFVRKVTAALSQSASNIRFACVLYAEYLRRGHLPGEREPWEYDVIPQDFVSPVLFDRFVAKAKPAGVEHNDSCDALELGLREARKLTWGQGPRYLVLIGNSPPHPTVAERRRYPDMLDRETEQYQHIDWRGEFEALARDVKPFFVSLWQAPAPTQTQVHGWQEFARSVWEVLGRDLRLTGLTGEDQWKLIDLVRAHEGKVAYLDAPVTLPSARPLAGAV